MYSEIQLKKSLSFDDKEDFCLRKQVELYYFLDRTKRGNLLLISFYCDTINKELNLMLETPFECKTIDDCVSIIDRLSTQLLDEYNNGNYNTNCSCVVRNKNIDQLKFYMEEVLKLWQSY